MKIAACLSAALLALTVSASAQPPAPERRPEQQQPCDSNGEACPEDAQPNAEEQAQSNRAQPSNEESQAPCDSNGEACPEDAKPQPQTGRSQRL